MTFWVAILALAAGITAVAVAPLWWPRRGSGDHPAADQLRRFEELEQDVASDAVEQSVASDLRAELERAVVDSIRAPQAAPATGSRLGATLFTVAIVLAAIPVYRFLGTPAIGEFIAANPGSDLREPDNAVELLLEQVRERTEQVPDDAQAWEILAQTELKRARYTAAVAAAERLTSLRPEDPRALLLLIDARAMSMQGRLDARARAMLHDVLRIEPDNPTALFVLGMAHAQTGARDQAEAAWRRARDRLPAAAPLRAELERIIGTAGPDADPTAASSPLGVDVRVSLMPDLDADVAPHATLFVILRSNRNGGPPLAVSRHLPDALPLTVRLDENNALRPTESWPVSENLTVIARISNTGEPLPQPGDLEGRSAPFALTDRNGVVLTIDRKLP